MVIVSDTSPISSLLRIGKLQILPAVCGKVVIPKMVADELRVLEKQGHDLSFVFEAEWLDIRTANAAPLLERLLQELDPGETEAIALAKELDADVLVGKQGC